MSLHTGLRMSLRTSLRAGLRMSLLLTYVAYVRSLHMAY